MRRRIENWVLKNLTKWYFKEYGLLELPDDEVLGGYARMDDPKILNTLRHRFTNFLAEQVAAKKGSEDINKGRLLELFGLLKDINEAKDNLVKLADYKERRKVGRRALSHITSKLTGFKKQFKKDSETK
jgi:hypothetical protein